MGTLFGDQDEEQQDQKQELKNMENGSLKKFDCSLDLDKVTQELEEAKDEWDCVEDVTFVYGSRKAVTNSSTLPISFDEAMEHFRSRDMSPFMVNIVPVITYSGMASIMRKLWGPPRLHPSLESSRNLLFAIASCPLENNESIHLRVLQTIYKQLVNCKHDVSRYGRHWDFIGFQGTDPATDLRGVGFLALMHLLYFVTEPATLPLARAILKISHHSTQNFPFAVMGINITRIVLQSLREERLNKECNRGKDVISVTNVFYVGIFLHLYETWQKQRLTIKDSGWVLKGVETTAKRKPKLVFQRLKHYVESQGNAIHLVSKPAIVVTDSSPTLASLAVKQCSIEADATPRICHMEPYPITDNDSISVDSDSIDSPVQVPCVLSVEQIKDVNCTTSYFNIRGEEDNGSYSGPEIFI